MIAKARSISHGSAMTSYATKHNRADIILTRNLDEGLTPLAMWGAMETSTRNMLRNSDISPSLSQPFGWRFPHPLMKPKDGHSMTGTSMRCGFLMSLRNKSKPRRERSEERASSIWTEHRFLPVFTLMQSLASHTCTSSSTASTLTEIL